MKKFTTIFMAFIISLMVVLTGCSTFSIDKVKYYNEVVARVGNENITRFDLVNAYNNYGYNTYVTQGGKSEKQALKQTAESLIERKLLVKYVQDSVKQDANSPYVLNEYEIKKLYRKQ